MTCIVGWCDQNQMVMGGDSAGVGNYHLMLRGDPKVFSLKQKESSDVLIGFTSSFRMGQLLMNMEVPQDSGGNSAADTFGFMVNKFIPEVRKVLKEGGFAHVEDNQEEGGTFLVGYRGHLFEIEEDYQVGVPLSPFYSVGCGAPYALGAMDILHQSSAKKDPTKMVQMALAVAERHNAGVRGPFRVETVDLNLRH